MSNPYIFADPRLGKPKTYLAQVEGVPTAEALTRLAKGVELNDGRTLPGAARAIDAPAWLWPPWFLPRANWSAAAATASGCSRWVGWSG